MGQLMRTNKLLLETKRRLLAWQVFAAISSAVAVGLILSRLVTSRPENGSSTSRLKTGEPQQLVKQSVQSCKPCETKHAVGLPNWEDPSVFQDLSPVELRGIVNYLYNQSDLNLTPAVDAVVGSSYIFCIDLHIPNKKEVFDYADRKNRKPKRSARVILYRGDLDPPVVEEYIVSPVPNPTDHEHIPNDTYTQYPIPYRSRPWSVPEESAMEEMIDKAAEEMKDLFAESYGAVKRNCDQKCLTFDPLGPLNQPGKGRMTIYIGLLKLQGRHLYPIGMDIVIANPGSDVAKWRIAYVVYNNDIYNSVQELMNQYRAGNLTLINYKYPNQTEKEYSTFRRRGYDPAKGKKGPRMYQPDGPRYKVSGQYVEYMDWSFHFRVPPIHGVQLFDVRYKGQRIAYEISPQDMVVLYSGYALNIITAQFLDLSYLLTKFEMIKGVDCPLESSYFDAHHVLNGDKVSHRKNVVCIFEYDTGIPLMKHYSNDFHGGFTFHGAVSDYVLTLRSTLSIYNYDYIIDFCFRNNGVVHVKFATTGYVIATYDFPSERNYGFQVHYAAVAPLHQHLVHFKVDLDILGERNSFVKYDIKRETIPHPWFTGLNETQTKIVQNKITTEKEAQVMYDFDTPQIYVVYSENSTNRYGSKRGYRIINQGMTKMLFKDEEAVRFMRWSKYQLAVTVCKDTEIRSSTPYTLSNDVDPVVDFDQFLEDDESIVNEDLVVWITMGVHHLPTSEDIPSVAIPGVLRSFYLKPFNYFDEDPSISSRDAAYIVPDKEYNNSYDRQSDVYCMPQRHGSDEYDGTW